MGAACGPERQGERCYSTNDIPNTDDVFWTRFCGVEWADIPEPAPFEARWPVYVQLPNDGTCPMCAADLDPLFWEDFKETVSIRGLAPDEDPNCLDDGYAILLACRALVTPQGDPLPDTECHYSAMIATNCTLDEVTPSATLPEHPTPPT